MADKLTKKRIDEFSYSGGWDVRWDSHTPGFGVRIFPSGKKSFVLRYSHNGRKRLMTIGRVGQITLEIARQQAIRSLGEVATRIDPLEEQLKAKRSGSVEQVFERFIEGYAKIHTKHWKEVERIFNTDVLPRIGSRKIDDVKRHDILRILENVIKRGKEKTGRGSNLTMANRTLAHIKRFFSWCVEQGIIESSPAGHISKPGPKIERDRILSDKELIRIWMALDAFEYPFGPLLKIAILTGQRRGEIASMQWKHIDFEKALWKIPTAMTKAKRAHTVPLSKFASSIIQSSPHIGHYVFTSKGTRPFENFSRDKAKMDDLLPSFVDAWNIHDLRRTFASGMARLGVLPHVIEKCLNHKNGSFSGVAGVYNRYDYSAEMRSGMELWSSHIQELLNETSVT